LGSASVVLGWSRPCPETCEGQPGRSGCAERIGLWWPSGSRPGWAKGCGSGEQTGAGPGRASRRLLLPSGQLAAVPESQGLSRSANRCAPFPCVLHWRSRRSVYYNSSTFPNSSGSAQQIISGLRVTAWRRWAACRQRPSSALSERMPGQGGGSSSCTANQWVRCSLSQLRERSSCARLITSALQRLTTRRWMADISIHDTRDAASAARRSIRRPAGALAARGG